MMKCIKGKNYHLGQSWGCFGEILQGVLPHNRNFLITMPINIKTTCTFNLEKTDTSHNFQVTPPSKTKSKKLARLLFEYYKLPFEGHIVLKSNIPEGKGLSSSTADLVAVSKALVAAFQIDYNPEELEMFFRQIEPSSGLLYSGMVIYFHREAVLFKHFTYVPNLIILGLDEGGTVDTLEYNNRQLFVSSQEQVYYEKLLEQFMFAVKTKNINVIGSIATKSTELNQKNNFKKSFTSLLKLNEEIDGLGVINAHSGTYIGILLNAEDPGLQEKINYCKKKYFLLGKEVQVFQTVHQHPAALNFNSL